jgi:hypothetical protein
MLHLLYIIVAVILAASVAVVGYNHSSLALPGRVNAAQNFMTQIQQLDAGLNAYLASTWDTDTQALTFADSDAALHAAVFPAFAFMPAPTDSESWHVGLRGTDDVFVCVHNIPESIRALVWGRTKEQFGSRALAGAACEDDSMRDSGSPSSVTVVTRAHHLRNMLLAERWRPVTEDADVPDSPASAPSSVAPHHPCYAIALGDTCFITGNDGIDYEVQYVGTVPGARGSPYLLGDGVTGTPNPDWGSSNPHPDAKGLPRRLFAALYDETAGSETFALPRYEMGFDASDPMAFQAFTGDFDLVDGWYQLVTDASFGWYSSLRDMILHLFPESTANHGNGWPYFAERLAHYNGGYSDYPLYDGWTISHNLRGFFPDSEVPAVMQCINKPGGIWYLPTASEFKTAHYFRNTALQAPLYTPRGTSGGTAGATILLGGAYTLLPAEVRDDYGGFMAPYVRARRNNYQTVGVRPEPAEMVADLTMHGYSVKYLSGDTFYGKSKGLGAYTYTTGGSYPQPDEGSFYAFSNEYLTEPVSLYNGSAVFKRVRCFAWLDF